MLSNSIIDSLAVNGCPLLFCRLIAYKSRVFYGTWWSTLSGYVNRMRGYYIAKHKLEGHADGTMVSKTHAGDILRSVNFVRLQMMSTPDSNALRIAVGNHDASRKVGTSRRRSACSR